MENYIVINGKKAELTEEQLKALGIEIKKDPFAREVKECYYSIAGNGRIAYDKDLDGQLDDNRFSVANYCTDKELMEQRALHETLSRLLWRASVRAGEMENSWNGDNRHWYIAHDCNHMAFLFDSNVAWKQNYAYFPTKKLAEDALKNIVEPFMEEHPEFVW